jgi:hypothetical protein
MDSEHTVKTTIRLPADLHWQFQAERANRRLSNEQAIREAFALWIANPRPRRGRLRSSAKGPTSTKVASVDPDSSEQHCILDLLEILRNRENPGRALTVTAVLRALAGPQDKEHGDQPVPDISQAVSGSEERVGQLSPDAIKAKPRLRKPPAPGGRTGRQRRDIHAARPAED